MIIEFFGFLYYSAFLLLGYGLPIILASIAFISNDKTKMSRWLIHFLIINVMEYTLFPIFDFIGLSFLSQTIGVAVLFIPVYISFDETCQNIFGLLQSKTEPIVEQLRQLTLVGLQKLNLV